MTNGLHEAKRPLTALAGKYGHPVHPMLVTVPIGAWISSVVFDVASRVVRPPALLVQGAEWLIAVGIVGALAASAASLIFLAVSGHLGGKLTYRYGVRVADEQTQGRAFVERGLAHPRTAAGSVSRAPVPPSYVPPGHAPPTHVPPARLAAAGPGATLGYYEQPASAWPDYPRAARPAPGAYAETYWRRSAGPPYEESAS